MSRPRLFHVGSLSRVTGSGQFVQDKAPIVSRLTCFTGLYFCRLLIALANEQSLVSIRSIIGSLRLSQDLSRFAKFQATHGVLAQTGHRLGARWRAMPPYLLS